MKFSTTIIDRRNEMSDLDRHRTRNIVWLQLAPVARLIDRVSVRVKRFERPGASVEFWFQIVVVLSSGKRIKTQASGNDIREAILLATDQMKVRVFNRTRIETTWLFRSSSALVEIWNSLAKRATRRQQRSSMRTPQLDS